VWHRTKKIKSNFALQYCDAQSIKVLPQKRSRCTLHAQSTRKERRRRELRHNFDNFPSINDPAHACALHFHAR
jgi:hypothetical protein